VGWPSGVLMMIVDDGCLRGAWRAPAEGLSAAVLERKQIQVLSCQTILLDAKCK
jgi:hypothetical protein